MKRKYSRAIKRAARQHGVPVEIAYHEIQQAIRAGYTSLDPAVQEYWKEIVPDGKMPSPEMMIEILSKKIKE